MMCVVMKDFLGGGEEYVRNEVVDGGIFRNEAVLISTRFLRPATQDEVQSAERVDIQPSTPPKKKSGLKAKVAKKKR